MNTVMHRHAQTLFAGYMWRIKCDPPRKEDINALNVHDIALQNI